MNEFAVVALVLGTLVVLLAPAIVLSSDLQERFKNMRGRAQRH